MADPKKPYSGVPPVIVLPVRNFVADNPAAVEFVSAAPPLPTDKAERELFVAKAFADVLQHRSRVWSELASVAPGRDPPDVTGKENGEPFGVEVGEIKSGERAASGDKLANFRQILSDRLATVRPKFKDIVFRVTFVDPLLAWQPLPKGAGLVDLAATVVGALETAWSGSAPLPPPLVAIEKTGTTDGRDPRRADPNDPVLLFDADAVAMTPGVVETVVSRIAQKKLQVSTAGKSYLLLWSRSTELSVLFPASCAAVDAILKAQPTIPYDEVFIYDMYHVDPKAMGFVINPERRAR